MASILVFKPVHRLGIQLDVALVHHSRTSYHSAGMFVYCFSSSEESVGEEWAIYRCESRRIIKRKTRN